MKLCVIDIGTNSLHAIFAEALANGDFKIISKEKEMVRLGDGAMVSGKLSDQTMQNAIVTLKRFAHMAKQQNIAEIIGMATSAVREAVNGGEFVDRIKLETGLTVRVITGMEEARLIHLAVHKNFNFNSKTGLIMDIGGGSTELILANKKEALWSSSFKLGANRLSQIIPLSDPPKKEELKKIESHVLEIFRPAFQRLKKNPAKIMIGTSGTLMNLATMILADRGEKKPDDIKTVTVTFQEVEKIYNEISVMGLEERKTIKGLDARRADMIVHGVASVYLLMREGKISKLQLCDKALREGIFYDFIEKNHYRLKMENRIPDVRLRHVLTLAHLCHYDVKHAEQVQALSLKIFDATSELHKLDKTDRELLGYAALLHDIGYHISYHKHHKHAFYLISNTDWQGFTEDEIQIMAWAVRFHRRSVSTKTKNTPENFPEAHRKRILTLASILRIADGLDHSHFALVHNLKLLVEKEKVTIKISSENDVEWEIHEANQRKELFEKVFGRPLSIENKKR